LINIPGYTYDEKLQIAKDHLIPKQLKKNGIQKNLITIPEETVRTLIADYSREAGVR
jgi:ATP-dependent Lon protease